MLKNKKTLLIVLTVVVIALFINNSYMKSSETGTTTPPISFASFLSARANYLAGGGLSSFISVANGWISTTNTTLPTNMVILTTGDWHNADYNAYKAVFEAEADQGASFLAVNGDLSDSSCSSMDASKAMLDSLSIPYQYTSGNHDMGCSTPFYNTPNYVQEHGDLVTFSLNICYTGSTGGEGIFDAADQSWLTTQLNTYANQNKDLIIFHHCMVVTNPQNPYHTAVSGAENMRALLEQNTDEYNRILVLGGHLHNTYNTQINGVNYFVVGSMDRYNDDSPKEYGKITITPESITVQSLQWESDSGASKPHSSTAQYNTLVIT